MSETPPAAPSIVFGTDGWRARIGEDYTYDNVRRCAQGVAEWVISEGMQAKVTLESYPDLEFSGRIEDITPVAQELSPRSLRRWPGG